MRIISEFHDYYDVVQAMGQDQSLLYLRKSREVVVETKKYPFPFILHYGRMYRNWIRLVSPTVHQFTIGFCGKIYPAIHLLHSHWGQIKPNEAWCFTLPEVDAFIEANFKKKEVEEYHLPKSPKKWRSDTKFWDSSVRRYRFEQLFAEFEAKKDAFREMFLEERCPIIVGYWRPQRDGCTITYNACLKDHEFFRVVEPYTAFQELQMFMSNLAVPLKEIPEIPDKDMAGIKGFDKWSFRKPPQE